MILRYVWKNFRRRRMRTFLMVLSLTVGIALIVALSATVETVSRSNVALIAQESGEFDISLRRRDTSPNPFIPVSEIAAAMLAADPAVRSVHPRFKVPVELTQGELSGAATMLALETAVEQIGSFELVDGELAFGPGEMVLLEDTALSFDWVVGEVVQVSYSWPQPREVGQPAPAGASQRRVSANFTVTGIARQNGVTGSDMTGGIIVDLAEVQRWLNLPDQAERLVAIIDPAIYDSSDAESAALQVRQVVQQIQAAVDDSYLFIMAKANFLDQAAQAFLITQAIINIYGVTALGIIGLLVHTLVMTNVQEQQREMAVLRILGSERRYLFMLVLGEVFVIGLISMVLGVVVGQLLTQYAVVPLIEQQLLRAGGRSILQPEVTISSVLPALVSATLVLFLSGLQPARRAAATKVMHAINPGVADNIQLEDLAQLRERKPSYRLFLVGLIMTWFFVMLLGLQLVSTLGNPGLEAAIIFTAFMLMVLGIGFIFFITTIPFERLILFLAGLMAPRFTYFAQRNVGRGQSRNTLISLLVLFSGILPSFLAASTALDDANLDSSVKMRLGAPVNVRIFGGEQDEETALLNRLRPSFLAQEMAPVPGLAERVGVSYAYRGQAYDTVALRQAAVDYFGLTDSLEKVSFPELITYVAGEHDAFARMLSEPNSVIIGEGLALHLAVNLGDKIILTGEGLDHEQEVVIVGILRRLPGFSGIKQSRQSAFGSSVLMALPTFRQLTTAPDDEVPGANEPVLTRILATTQPGADGSVLAADLNERFSRDFPLWVQILAVQLQFAEQNMLQQRVLLLVLTSISFTTAVFGVFAVIYVTIYARRVEIGMMKAIGMRNYELTGTLIVEAIAMTLSAALAGITAGTCMGLVVYVGEALGSGSPFVFALDGVVGPFIVLMVVLASVVGASFSARRIIKRRAIEILRMV